MKKLNFIVLLLLLICFNFSTGWAQLTVSVTNQTAVLGQTVTVPVILTGAWTPSTAITTANIKLAYDPAVLKYNALVNFYAGLGPEPWQYSGNYDPGCNSYAVSANWADYLYSYQVPDNTTLFEIQFTYLGGSCSLTFCLTEFSDPNYNFMTVNPVNGTVNPIITPGYVAGDFHQHTTYTDGNYSYGHVMGKNNQYGLNWWANSEHGGGFTRDGGVSGLDIPDTVYWDEYTPIPCLGTLLLSGGHRVMWRWQSLRDYEFARCMTARTTYPTKMIIQSYEMNVPGHEHASLGIVANQFTTYPQNCSPLAEFEYKFDNSDTDGPGGASQGWIKSILSGHAKAVEAVTWLQTNYTLKSYLIAAHPERKNLNNIAGFRDMNNAGPNVCFGFESMPGHQKGTDRGEYKPSNNSVGSYTYGGCGIYAARVGGLWDAMLSEGRHWWLFASSDFHNETIDFYPGEYQKTYTYVDDKNNYLEYIDGLRSGNSYIVNGDIIDSLSFRIGETPAMTTYATMGGTLTTTQNSVVIKIVVRDPVGTNNNTYGSYNNPSLDHIDLIQGKVSGLIAPASPNYSVDSVTTTHVIARFDAVGGVVSPNGIVSQAWTNLGGVISIEYTYNFPTPPDTLYFRLRGTNLGLNVANETDVNGNPLSDGLMAPNSATKAFADLWFYSNPIFVNGNGTHALSGPINVCQGSTGNVYTTDAGKTNYSWTVSGGSVTAGGGSTDNTVTVTWPTAGSHSVSVSYFGSGTTNLPVNVASNLTVGVSILASNNPVCAGTSVTFTATPENGGSSPNYQWKKNGSNVGTNNPEYTYVPVNGDVIICVLTSSEVCTTGNPATSNSITMTVNPKLTVKVGISVNDSIVPVGTPVTFTATPTNGGTSPLYEWKVNGITVPGVTGNIYTYTPLNGDQVFCLLTSSEPCVNNRIAMSRMITLVVYQDTLMVTLPTLTAYVSDPVTMDVRLKGASASGTPITTAWIEVSYDTNVLTYVGLSNFNTLIPQGQWVYSAVQGVISANWAEPNYNGTTVAIPDSATLFDINFTYNGSTSTVVFDIHEFTDANYNSILTNHVNGLVSPEVPLNAVLQNITLGNGEDSCYNASETITVAGSGTTFLVQNGGSATLIAGQSIHMLYGTTVVAGGYLHAYITTTNEYCINPAKPLASNPEVIPESVDIPELIYSTQNIMVYPNPTSGKFTVELTGSDGSVIDKIQVYAMNGIKLMSVETVGTRKHELSVSGFQPGIYFVHIVTGFNSEIVKIIKY